MTDAVYCPDCGGHTKEVQYDVLRGEPVYVCDAYRPCGWFGLFEVAGSGARSGEREPIGELRETAQLVLGRLTDSAAPRTRAPARDGGDL